MVVFHRYVGFSEGPDKPLCDYNPVVENTSQPYLNISVAKKKYVQLQLEKYAAVYHLAI